MNFAGIDIGGANIKFVASTGEGQQIEFPIWQDKHRLPFVLAELAAELTTPTCLGVTMTAELADCFDSKQAGVEFVVTTVDQAFGASAPLYYQTDGGMCDGQSAVENWQAVAASNWHALAWFAFLDSEQRSGFVLDIGSTTTDIIPVEGGVPVVNGQNDFARLTNNQLFYAGVGRTPVCSLLDEVNFEFATVTIARELFATMLDVFLWLGDVDASNSTNTADGRTATKANAGRRLARMVCADPDELNVDELNSIANQAKAKLLCHLSCCLQSVVTSHPTLPLIFRTFGGGAWLAEEVMVKTFSDPSDSQPTIIAYSPDETANQTAAAQAVAKKRELVFAQR